MQFREHHLGHPPLAEPIGAHQRIGWNTLLGKASGVLDRCARRLDALDRDIVAHSVQQGVHIGLDAGAQQVRVAGIVAQIGDIVFERGANGRAHLRHPGVQPGGDLLHVAVHRDTAVAPRDRHLSTVVPGADGGGGLTGVERNVVTVRNRDLVVSVRGRRDSSR